MKRLLYVTLAVLAVFSLTVPALAVNADDYWYQDSGGVWIYDQAGYDLAVAVEAVQAADLDLDPYAYLYTDASGNHFDTAGFQAAYDQALAAKEAAEAPSLEPDPVETDTPVESEEEDNGQPAEDPVILDSWYPIGDYFADEDGNLYYPNGQIAGTQPAGDVSEDDTLSPDVLGPEDAAEALEDPGEDSYPVYSVNDLRSVDDPAVSPLPGLKALVVSIFGEYEPVMTTAAVTETVGEETTTTLVDTVASGAAGVDYEWLAGVFLFGILLFCLMRLLGGILK